MKNKFLYIALISCIGLLSANCGGNTEDEKRAKSREAMWDTKTTDVKVSSLPSITFEEMKVIYEGADFIDIIFYNVDFSMSINNKTNIQKRVGFVSTKVAQINPNWKAMGRIFFQKNGEMLAEADMYYDDQCRYFVFQKNGKAAYANDITPQGQAYFAKIFSQVKVEEVGKE